MSASKNTVSENWQVICVKPRFEKKTAERLENKGIPVYCPTVTNIRQWSDRKKKVQVPLFSKYLFVQLPEKERKRVFEVPGVIRYLYWLKKPAIVRNEEIQLIKKWLSKEGASAEIENLSRGDHLRIESGPFKGQRGITEHIGGNKIQLILMDLGVKISIHCSTEVKKLTQS